MAPAGREKSHTTRNADFRTQLKKKDYQKRRPQGAKNFILPETACDQGSFCFFFCFFSRNFQISENSPYIHIRNFTIYIPCMVNHIPAPAARGEYFRQLHKVYKQKQG